MKKIYIIIIVLSVFSCKKSTQCTNSQFIPKSPNKEHVINKKGKLKVVTGDCGKYIIQVNGINAYQDSTGNSERVFDLNEYDIYQVTTICDTVSSPIQVFQRYKECD